MSDEAITDGGHTAGPWRAVPAEDSFFRDVNILQADGLAVGVALQNGDILPSQAERNGHLFAAAPDLYEALKTLHGYVVQAWPSLSDFPSVKAAHAALAKARPQGGES